ncbi:MAG TPA: GAF domain-containing protein, partial [Candidatus Binatia bacterium]
MILAGQAAIAIHNARLYEETHRSRKELETTNQSLERSLRQLDGLHTALAPIAAARSIHEAVGEIIDRLIDATGADAALIRTWDKNAGVYPVIGQRGFSNEYLKLGGTAAGGAVDWVTTHGEPIIAPDIASDSHLKGKLQLQIGLQSCAILPLKIHDEVRGVIHVASRQIGYFDEEQKDHLTAIARQMSIAMENRELFNSLKSSRDALEQANTALTESNRMLSALHTVGAATSQTLDIDKILQSAIERITEIFGFDATHIHVYDPQKDELTLRAYFESDPAGFTSARSFKKGQGIVGRVVESGETLVFDDVQTDAQYRQLSRSETSGQHGYHFFAVLPIKGRREIFGTLACVGNDARKLSTTETQMLEAITGQIAIALENSMLYQNVREKVGELQQVNTALQDTNRMVSALHSVAAAANQSLDLNRVLQAAIGKIVDTFDFDATQIHLLDADTGQLIRQASYEKHPERFTSVTTFKLGQGVVGKVAETGQALVFENIETDPTYHQLTQTSRTQQFNDRFFAVFPIRSKSGTLGTLACLGHETRKLSTAEIQLLEAITDQVAVAIENARLFEKNESSKKDLETTVRFLDKSLNQLAGLYMARTPLGLSESLAEMMNGIVDRLIEATGADAGLIRIWDKNDRTYPVIGQRGYTTEFVEELRPEGSEGA